MMNSNVGRGPKLAKHTDADSLSQKGPVADDENGLPHAEQKKVMRRVDLRLLMTCGLMYSISLMDRSNIAFAAVAGMIRDLNLIGYRYSIILLVFFIPYVLFQPPATVVCRKVGPRVFLAAITFTWGIVVIGFGFPNAWQPMVALRLLLGALEAGFFPAVVYMISTWYTRYEMQKRYAIFYVVGSLAASLSGILAYGLTQMDGLAGIAGWRWIFIIEGVFTCLVGIVGFYFLVGFPDTPIEPTRSFFGRSFLTENEQRWILRRLKEDRDDVTLEPFNFRKWAAAGADLKVWAFGMIFFCGATISYSISYYLPIILRDNLGFSLAASQCLVAPPYVGAALLMYGTAWFGDRYKLRAPVLVLCALISLAGVVLMGYAGTAGLRLFGVFLVVAGVNSTLPAVMAYQGNNIRGQWKRAFSSALLVGLGAVGGIAGSLVFRSQDAPLYRPGIIASIVCSLAILVICGALTAYFHICNKKADQGKMIIEGLEGFRYTL